MSPHQFDADVSWSVQRSTNLVLSGNWRLAWEGLMAAWRKLV